MVLDMILNKDQSMLYSASVDCKARSWLPEAGGEAKIFEGGERSITLLYLKGQVCESLREMNFFCTFAHKQNPIGPIHSGKYF